MISGRPPSHPPPVNGSGRGSLADADIVPLAREHSWVGLFTVTDHLFGGIWRRRVAASAGAGNKTLDTLAHSHTPPEKGQALVGSAGQRSGR